MKADFGLIGWMAITCGVLANLGPLAQAYRVIQLEDSREVSLLWLHLYMLASLAFLFYGIAINSWPLIVVDTIGFLTTLVCIVAVGFYRSIDG